jgi:hypothetical protein
MIGPLMIPEEAIIRETAFDALRILSSAGPVAFLKMLAGSRLTEANIRDAIAAYGRNPVSAPDCAKDDIEITRMEGKTRFVWFVVLPFWTLEEGRSDLSLEMTVELEDQRVLAFLDDIRVL